jgi:AraC-like DNA-binding protein
MVRAGELRIKLNLVEYSVQQNQLLIIPPGFVRHIRYISPDCQITGIAFTNKLLGETGLHHKHIDAFYFFSSNSNPRMLLTEEEAHNIWHLMLKLRQKEKLPVSYAFRKEMIEHTFSLLLFELAAFFKNRDYWGEVRLTRREDLAMDFLKILRENFRTERSVQYYAQQLFVSPKHLTKTVKDVTGKTCGELIDEMVIMEAKLLLDNHELTVANVADTLHFSDQFFFSKFFKKHTRMTPTQYRSGI